MQELERGDSGLRSFASVQGALAMYPIYAFGTETQKMDWLPRLARGEKGACFGLTESDHGSDPAGMVTKAVRRGDHYVLNGSKLWITNGTIADVAVVWARTEEGIRGFLVEKGTPGFSAREIHGKFSLRASITSELIFQDCRIPSASLLPGSEQGLKAAFMCLDQARDGIAWGAVGAATACSDAPSRPLAKLKGPARVHHTHISLAKMNNVEKAREIARLAREILGAAGIVDEYPVIRHMLNLETLYTYEGEHEITTLILGRA